MPLAGNPISWLSSTDSASGGTYPDSFEWAVPSVAATALALASNLSWWGAALAGRTVASAWNGGAVTGTPPAVRTVRDTPGPCSTWFVSRFPLGSMTVTRVRIQLVEVARINGKAGVFEIHGIAPVGGTSVVSARTAASWSGFFHWKLSLYSCMEGLFSAPSGSDS